MQLVRLDRRGSLGCTELEAWFDPDTAPASSRDNPWLGCSAALRTGTREPKTAPSSSSRAFFQRACAGRNGRLGELARFSSVSAEITSCSPCRAVPPSARTAGVASNCCVPCTGQNGRPGEQARFSSVSAEITSCSPGRSRLPGLDSARATDGIRGRSRRSRRWKTDVVWSSISVLIAKRLSVGPEICPLVRLTQNRRPQGLSRKL